MFTRGFVDLPFLHAAAMPYPSLTQLDFSCQSYSFATPTKCINDDGDVPRFLRTKAYRDIGIFLMQLNRAVVPRRTSSGADTFPLPQGSLSSPLIELMPPPEHRSLPTQDVPPALELLPDSIQRLQQLLERVKAFVKEAAPDPGPRRFGNISFRKWHQLLVEHSASLIGELILPLLSSKATLARAEIEAYFLGAFGSSQRLDYGTGHELSFFAFLGCLWKLGYFATSPTDVRATTLQSRLIVLHVFEPYLATIRMLIRTYKLETAGSHGVWGLDDHAFLPYVFGSAQLTRPITEDEPTPLEGSVKGAPNTGDVVKTAVVERWRASNMYFSAVGFINDVKTGPFWEHSSMLYNISGVTAGWGKINKVCSCRCLRRFSSRC